MKIGIITHFYNNTNFGGNLQAFALAKTLSNIGHNSEQLNFKFDYLPISKFKRFKIFLCRLKSKILKRDAIEFNARQKIEIWQNENVPSSKVIYNKKNIKKSLKEYDAFITGSDQVWNYDWYNPEFFLNFVPKRKIKLSYAASMGKTTISEYEKKVYINHLKSFKAISVREKDMVDLLSDKKIPKIQQVVDPVFLLSQDEWNEITEKPLLDDDYIFAFFLGKSKTERELVKEFSKKKKIKIVAIENVMGNEDNEKFADEFLKNIDPSGFLSLIKNAKYVFTDSFHATAFSAIFEKQVYIFEREGMKGMNSRITSLFDFFPLADNFVDSFEKQNIEHILNIKKIKYSTNENFDNAKEKSIEFLKYNLL